MAAHRVEQSECRARHVAVVATAAVGIRRMMRVRRDLRRHGLVTLQTSSVAIHFWFQLRVMRPSLQTRFVRRFKMHFMT